MLVVCETKSGKQLTNQYNVIIELTLIFAFPIHLCHLLQRREHGLDNLVIRGIHDLSYFERAGTNELCLHTADIGREVSDELSRAAALLAGQLRILDRFDLFVLSGLELTRDISHQVRNAYDTAFIEPLHP